MTAGADMHRPGAPLPEPPAGRQAARIAGAAYLVQYVTSVFPMFYVRPALIVSGDAAATVGNIASHPQLFRVGIVCDLLAGVFVTVLNAALYHLLAPVDRGVARLAAFWRLIEVAVGSAITVSSFLVLAMVGGAQPPGFEPRATQGLVHLLVGAQESGFMVVLLFFGLGSATYMALLVRSRYVPKALAVLGLVGSAGAAVFALTRMLFPAFVADAVKAVSRLPTVALVALGVIMAPLALFEFAFGVWLLAKGARAAAD